MRVIDPGGAIFGSTVDYGKYHQTGGERLPMRKIIQMSNRFTKAMFNAAMAYILRGHVWGKSEADDAGEH